METGPAGQNFYRYLRGIIVKHLDKIKRILRKMTEHMPSIVSAASIIISILTLHEMQVERNHAYLPRVVIEDSACKCASDITLLQKPYNLIVYIDELPLFIPDMDGLTLGTGNEPIHEDVYITVSNIGNGIAEDITFLFDEDNRWVKRVIEIINEMNPDSPYSWTEDQKTGILQIQKNGFVFGTFEDSCKLSYLLANGEKTSTVYLPAKCSNFLEIYINYIYYSTSDFLWNLNRIPDLPVKILYHDIQGNKYERELMIKIEGEYVFIDLEEGTYYINVKFSSDNTAVGATTHP